MKLKRILVFAMTLSMMGITIGCSGSSDTNDSADNDVSTEVTTTTVAQTEEAVEETTTIEQTEDVTEESTTSTEESCVKIVSHSLSKDYNGKDVLVIEYEWTNTDEKATSFMVEFSDKVFQNGIECSSTVVGCDEIDSQQQMNDVQPGATYNLKVGYLLQDNTSANVVLTSLFGDTTYLDETIDLGGGEGESAQQEESSDVAETSFSIVSTSISKDYNDEDVLIVEYAFYNGEDKATSFTFACTDKVFQNGVECDSTVLGCDDLDSQQQLNDVQSGATYNVKVGYHLQDKSEVNIVVTDLFGDYEYLNETISLE